VSACTNAPQVEVATYCPFEGVGRGGRLPHGGLIMDGRFERPIVLEVLYNILAMSLLVVMVVVAWLAWA
jgi:hypothetical protein